MSSGRNYSNNALDKNQHGLRAREQQSTLVKNEIILFRNCLQFNFFFVFHDIKYQEPKKNHIFGLFSKNLPYIRIMIMSIEIILKHESAGLHLTLGKIQLFLNDLDLFLRPTATLYSTSLFKC